MCCHEITSAQVANNGAWISTPHDRQPPDIVTQHLGRRFMKNFIWKRHNYITAPGIEYRCSIIAALFQRPQHIAVSDDPDQLPIVIDNQQALVASHLRITLRNAI